MNNVVNLTSELSKIEEKIEKLNEKKKQLKSQLSQNNVCLFLNFIEDIQKSFIDWEINNSFELRISTVPFYALKTLGILCDSIVPLDAFSIQTTYNISPIQTGISFQCFNKHNKSIVELQFESRKEMIEFIKLFSLKVKLSSTYKKQLEQTICDYEFFKSYF